MSRLDISLFLYLGWALGYLFGYLTGLWLGVVNCQDRHRRHP